MAKLAKAAALKAAAPSGACGFESRPGHPLHANCINFATWQIVKLMQFGRLALQFAGFGGA